MLKKILYIFPTTLGSACLDTNISSVAQDSLALAEIFENYNYEVWMYNPYLRKKSSWPRQVQIEDIRNWEGDIIFAAQQGHLRQLTGQSVRPIKWDTNFQKVIKDVYYLLTQNNKIYIPIFDVKTYNFTPPVADIYYKYLLNNPINKDRGDEQLLSNYYYICLNSSLIFPDKESAKILSNDLLLDNNREVYEMNIFDHTHKHIKFPICLEPTTHDFIYTGFVLTDYRKQRLNHFFKDNKTLKLGQAGSVRIPKKLGFESLSNFKQISHDSNMILLCKSRFQLVLGEPTNSFLTPRLFMSLLGDSLTFVDSDYKAAVEWCKENSLDYLIVSDLEELNRKYNDRMRSKYLHVGMEQQIATNWLNSRPYIFKELEL